MGTIIIYFFLCAISIFLIPFSILNYLIKKTKKEAFEYSLVVSFIFIILGLVVGSFYFPEWYINTFKAVDLQSKGQIGDMFGGLTNPIIGIAAVLVTGLAFYAQYQANLQVQNQFAIQKFESQFYEMLKLHKENVQEMVLNAKDKYSDEKSVIAKRAVFSEMQKEFESLLQIAVDKELILDEKVFKSCYEIFLWGSEECSNNFEEDDIYFEAVKNAKYYQYYKAGDLPRNADIFVLAFKSSAYLGHSSQLGHYFRHLFLIVKYVTNEKDSFLSYESKMNYLKILRAQLSNHEQIMLFYNWLVTNYGSAWEDEKPDGNKFFTDYKMIHNLWVDELFQHQLIVDKVNYLIDKYNSNPKETPLFEFQRNDFKQRMPDVPVVLGGE